MATWKPDPSFYPSPRMAAKAPAESLAYVAAFDPDRQKPDAIAVVDVNPKSSSYSEIVGQTEMPNVGDELHHFGWNACSSCLCPNAPHPNVERRYIIVPGLRSSRLHIIDTEKFFKSPGNICRRICATNWPIVFPACCHRPCRPSRSPPCERSPRQLHCSLLQ